jgi:class 3 adenylate cyclase
MNEDRKLAAIMFTDIVGYTALMGTDQDRAFEVLHKNREIHLSLIEKYHGKLIKELGDGMLAQFSSALDAVRCALDIQEKVAGSQLEVMTTYSVMGLT